MSDILSVQAGTLTSVGENVGSAERNGREKIIRFTLGQPFVDNAMVQQSEIHDLDVHARLEEAVNEAQYSYLIGDKASESRWLERAVAMIHRRIHVIGKADTQDLTAFT